jgi:hypothetical protein
MRWISRCLGVVLVVSTTWGTVQAATPEPVRIGDRWELLVDHYLVEQMQGDVTLRLHEPVPQEVVLAHDQPWEGNSCGYHTIFQDGPIYRMYYRGWNHDMRTEKQTHPAVVCYAESRDGIHWERPTLNLVEFQGSKQNNILWAGPGTHNFVPFKDTNPQCPSDARYKAVARGEDEYSKALLAFKSSDGLHWELLTEKPILTQGAFDSQNLAFWDPVRQEYRCYFRDFREGRRDIKVSTSQDFLHWTEPEWLQFPEAPKEHLYTNAVMPYDRAPHLLLGFPTRYLPERGSLTEGLFMSSRDGLTFHRWAEAFVRPGLNADKWHNRSNYIWWGLAETPSPLPGGGRELSLYVNEGYYFESKAARTRRYTCRVDGFVSLHASFAGGQILTKPVLFEGGRLVVNFSTSAAGGLQVQIEDLEGRAVPGFAFSDCPEMYGDAIERTVTWQRGSDVSTLAGKPIRLRLALRDADVYALGFRGPLPRFREHTISSELKYGYQLVAADLNKDGKKDLIAVDERATEVAWFENRYPNWERHVLADNVPRPLNADCWDIDADGVPEVVLAYRFEPDPQKSVGNVVLLKSESDVRQPWTAREIDRVPTAHRVRWIDPEGKGRKVLLVGPMVGAQYPPVPDDPVPIYLYRPGDWKRETLSTDARGVLHAINPVSWDGGALQQLLTACYLGLHRYELTGGKWVATSISKGDPRPWPLCGSSEVRLGHLGPSRFLAAIEPWHGNQLVVYLPDGQAWQRLVLDDKMDNGHALAVGDLNGDGRDEIVCGFRGRGYRLSIYRAADVRGEHWESTVLDNGGIAAADAAVGDFTGDGKPDIACIGASTHNVKLYENLDK